MWQTLLHGLQWKSWRDHHHRHWQQSLKKKFLIVSRRSFCWNSYSLVSVCHHDLGIMTLQLSKQDWKTLWYKKWPLSTRTKQVHEFMQAQVIILRVISCKKKLLATHKHCTLGFLRLFLLSKLLKKVNCVIFVIHGETTSGAIYWRAVIFGTKTFWIRFEWIKNLWFLNSKEEVRKAHCAIVHNILLWRVKITRSRTFERHFLFSYFTHSCCSFFILLLPIIHRTSYSSFEPKKTSASDFRI